MAAAVHGPEVAGAAMVAAVVVAQPTVATASLRAMAAVAAVAIMVGVHRSSRVTRRTASRIPCVAQAMWHHAPARHVSPIRCAPTSI